MFFARKILLPWVENLTVHQRLTLHRYLLAGLIVSKVWSRYHFPQVSNKEGKKHLSKPHLYVNVASSNTFFAKKIILPWIENLAVLRLKIHWLLLLGLTEQVPDTKSEENELILQLCVMYMLICRQARVKGERHVVRFCFYNVARTLFKLQNIYRN